jgi:ATP-dependent DNA helicase RecQ
MVDYCKTTRCLRRTVLRYFGEEQDDKCEYCSNCLDPRSLTDVTAAARLFVNAVRRYDERFGARLIMDMLRGSENSRIISLRLDRSEYYGVLSGMSLSNLQYLMDALVDDEILEITTGDYPLIRCGKNADDLLDGYRNVHAYQEAITAKKSSTAKKADNLPEDIDQVLFEELRKERLRISKVRSVPPDVICGDSVLVDMCRKLPTNKDQMIFVKGMGERKVASFGSSFAKLIREYLGNNNK